MKEKSMDDLIKLSLRNRQDHSESLINAFKHAADNKNKKHKSNNLIDRLNYARSYRVFNKMKSEAIGSKKFGKFLINLDNKYSKYDMGEIFRRWQNHSRFYKKIEDDDKNKKVTIKNTNELVKLIKSGINRNTLEDMKEYQLNNIVSHIIYIHII